MRQCDHWIQKLPIAVLVTAAFMAPTGTVEASDLLVPSQYSTIQGAIDASASGDRVLVAPGFYFEPIDYLGKAIEVIGLGGSAQTTLSILSVDSVVTIDAVSHPAPLSLIGFTILAGSGRVIGNPPSLAGGGVFVRDSDPLLSDLVLTGNSATLGGGLYAQNAGLTVDAVSFVDNGAADGAGAFFVDVEGDLTDCVFEANDAFSRGGAMELIRSPIKVYDSLFLANLAARGAGLSFSDNSDAEVYDCTVIGNIAVEHGGGISIDQFSDVILSGLFVTENEAAQGGGIGITHFSQAQLFDVTITQNTAGEGGGLRIFESVPSLDRVVIRGNSATGFAGESGKGGGIHASLRVDSRMRNVLVADNTAIDAGGGIYWWGDCAPTLIHCTVAGNSSQTIGGAMISENYSVPDIWNSIVYANTAPGGSLLAQDSTGEWIFRYCNVEGGGLGPVHFLNFDADPLFNADYRITECSPSADSGSSTAPYIPGTDLDGAPRVQGLKPDQGVNELPVTAGPCFVRGDATADGIINVGDVIASLDYLFIGNFDPPCQDALDVDDSGLVDIGDPIAAMNYLFQGGSPPPPPEPVNPAADPTADLIGCSPLDG